MTERDGRQGPEDRAAALLLQTQGHREEPAHAGIDAVIRAQNKQCERSPVPRHRPEPVGAHGKQNESEEESPPSSRT